MNKYIKDFLIIFLISVLMGLLMSQILKSGSKGDIIAQNIAGDTSEVDGLEEMYVQTSSQSEEKISPLATLTRETTYEDCKHTVIEKGKVPENLVDLSKNELKKEYSDWFITEFSDRNVYLYKLSEGLCDDHFKVTKNEDGIVEVYKLKNNYDTKLYQTTDITTEYLPEEDVKKLEEGIYVYGEAELNSILESFE